jgi:flagellar motor switch protein FliN/FliY
MNQMMGAASTAMSDFLGYPVNISTPEPFELDDIEKFKEEHLPKNVNQLVVVRFKLTIEEALESEFMNVMTVDLARTLLAGLGLEEDGDEGESPAPAAPAPKQEAAPQPAPQPAQPEPAAQESGGGGKLSQEEIERLMSGLQTEEPAQAAPTPSPPASQPAPAARAPEPVAPPPQQPMQQPPQTMNPPMQQPVGYPPMYGNMYPGYQAAPMYAQMPVAPQPKMINTQPVVMQQFAAPESLGEEQAENLDLIMEVPLQVSVEIGRTRRKVKEILEYSKGSLVVLDKLAGDQVDLFVNGKCIARGDVVVIEDNFGVRITEIVQKPTVKEIIKK